MDCKDRFEVFYTKEDIIAIRKLLFRKKFRSRVIILVGLTLYAIFLSSHLPVFWNESQSDMFILCVFCGDFIIQDEHVLFLFFFLHHYMGITRQHQSEIKKSFIFSEAL